MNRMVVLYRPVGPQELALIEASGWKAFPPRLSTQPFFYPVANQQYAEEIARDWNAKDNGSGFVTRFNVKKEFLAAYPLRKVGTGKHLEYWIPAEQLGMFNTNIVGAITVVASFGG